MSANLRLSLVLLGVVCGMVALTFASPRLYDAFCRASGYGGTVRRVAAAPAAATATGGRVVTVRFNADVAAGLPWTFRTPDGPVDLVPGQPALVSFHAVNRGARSITGMAVFNVTPQKAGRYFDKTQCFCFTEQALAPGEAADLPVAFFIDPAIGEDPDMDDVDTITLSYTFYRARTDAAGP
jgi:cytochrome c oxidase assembly protein subunit 11